MSMENEKDNIVAILKENGYDTNSPNTISLLSSIINSRIVNYIHSDKDAIIRILSKDEYDKYIKESTLDGSVAKYSKNVFHYFDEEQNNKVGIFVFNSGQTASAAYQPTQSGSNCYNDGGLSGGTWLNSPIKDVNEFYTEFANTGRHKDVYFNILTECLADNTNAVTLGLYKSKLYILIVRSHDNDKCFGIRGVYSNASQQHNKNMTAYEMSSGWAGYRQNSATMHIMGIKCFRPVFQYKNNSKSKNLYY